jgi:hypothetical protein
MVPLKDPERVSQRGGVERSDVDSGLPERLPEPATGGPTADPIVQHPDVNSFTGFPYQGVSEHSADPVVTEDVVLEVDVALGLVDGLDPRVERIGPIELQPNGVAIQP